LEAFDRLRPGGPRLDGIIDPERKLPERSGHGLAEWLRAAAGIRHRARIGNVIRDERCWMGCALGVWGEAEIFE
jgi:hypothetical protein